VALKEKNGLIPLSKVLCGLPAELVTRASIKIFAGSQSEPGVADALATGVAEGAGERMPETQLTAADTPAIISVTNSTTTANAMILRIRKFGFLLMLQG
jgi:hypothetical protein